MTERFELFDPRVHTAVLRLQDANITERRQLIQARVPNRMRMQHAVFPPEDFHRNSVPARYQFEMGTWVTGEINLMSFWYCTRGDDSEYTFIGLVSHNQRDEWRKLINYDVPIDRQFVAIKYKPYAHEGHIYMDRELYHMFCVLNSEELYSARDNARQESQRMARVK